MVITVTSIKLKRLWHFFKLSYLGLTIVRQTKAQQGFIKMKNTGFGYLHYTISAWESEADLKNFAKTGAHLAAMKEGRSIAHEVKTYTYRSDNLPNWKEVKELLARNGKAVNYD